MVAESTDILRPISQLGCAQACSGVIDDKLNVHTLQSCINAANVEALQELAGKVALDQQVLEYAVRIVRATRNSAAIIKGAGPRASIALVRSGRARALLRGQEFVLPDDIKAMALPVLRHRIILSADMEIEGKTNDGILAYLLEHVEAPRL